MKKKTLKERMKDYLADEARQALPSALLRGRGAGHTEAMLKVAEATGATVVFAVYSQTLPYRNRFPNVNFQSLMTIGSGCDGDGEGPVLFDNSVWTCLANIVIDSAALLREASRKMEQAEMAINGV